MTARFAAAAALLAAASLLACAGQAKAAPVDFGAEAARRAAVQPQVATRAEGKPRSSRAVDVRHDARGIPSRVTVEIGPANGAPFYAEVDLVRESPDDELPSIYELACTTSLAPRARKGARDVCQADPAAVVAAADDRVMFVDEAPPKPVCAKPALPADFLVMAAGEYNGREAGFQIDGSGHEATLMDIEVNITDKPVVLMLGAYEPTIWTVSWTPGTRIVAVLSGGYHRQRVTGLEPSVPVLGSSYEDRSPCPSFYITQSDMKQLNPIARDLLGRPVDKLYFAKQGRARVGEPIAPGTKLVSVSAQPPEAFRLPGSPRAGRAGLEDALRAGVLRRATPADAQAWVDEVKKRRPRADVPPIAGEGEREPRRPHIEHAYVVLGPFTYPSGLYREIAAFFIPKGVPKPKGNPGHSNVYDFEALTSRF